MKSIIKYSLIIICTSLVTLLSVAYVLSPFIMSEIVLKENAEFSYKERERFINFSFNNGAGQISVSQAFIIGESEVLDVDVLSAFFDKDPKDMFLYVYLPLIILTAALLMTSAPKLEII